MDGETKTLAIFVTMLIIAVIVTVCVHEFGHMIVAYSTGGSVTGIGVNRQCAYVQITGGDQLFINLAGMLAVLILTGLAYSIRNYVIAIAGAVNTFTEGIHIFDMQDMSKMYQIAPIFTDMFCIASVFAATYVAAYLVCEQFKVGFKDTELTDGKTITAMMVAAIMAIITLIIIKII